MGDVWDVRGSCVTSIWDARFPVSSALAVHQCKKMMSFT